MAWQSSSRRYLSYRDSRSFKRRVGKFAGLLFLVFLLFQVVSAHVFRSYVVNSKVMEPGFTPGDYLLASPSAYRILLPLTGHRLFQLAEPGRGEVVLVRPPYAPDRSFLEALIEPALGFFSLQQVRYPFSSAQKWQQDEVVRRVVGLPGDRIVIRSHEAFVKPQGAADFVSEHFLSLTPYETERSPIPRGWEADLPLSGELAEFVLGKDQYFLLGDNRVLALDSRVWGPVGSASIKGRILFRYWSTSRLLNREN